MGIKLSKKGIMFTILSVLVCALIITSFFTFQGVSLDSDVDNVKLRIMTIDRYVSETDLYIKSITNVAGTKTINYMNSMMMGNNSYLNNYTKQFESCLMTGKLNTSPFGSGFLVNCPNESFISSKFELLENFSRSKLNIDSNITLNNVSLSQDNPWNLKVEINYTIVINDSYALWNETRVVYSRINIIGFKDPTSWIINPITNSDIYSVRYVTTVNSTFNQYWTEFPSVAHQMVLKKQYFFWAGAPSYLNRLNNINAPSACCGIVSIVSNDFIDESLLTPPPAINRSSLDFEFWRNTNVNYYGYRKYDFWNPSVSNAYRINAGINSTMPGLNGTIVRNEVASIFNMTNTTYLRVI